MRGLTMRAPDVTPPCFHSIPVEGGHAVTKVWMVAAP